MSAAKRIPSEPPERLTDEQAEVWRDVVARDAIDVRVDPVMLEAYCALVVRWRETSKKVAAEGQVVEGARGAFQVHPAIAVERQLAEQLREWGPMFNRPPRAQRKSGPMYDSTRASIAAAFDLKDKHKRFRGACDAVLTLAWLIDEAQRAGLDELRKASHVVIPTYLKGCAALQITPASLPAAIRKKAEAGGGKLRKFEDAAAAREQRARAG